MIAPQPPAQPSQRLVFWIIWAAILSGVFVMQFTIGHGIPSGNNDRGVPVSPMAFVAIGQVVIATVIRWLWIPRLTQPRQQLVAMIIGVALAEAANTFGLFLIAPNQPETKLLIFVLAIVGIVQFAPTYVRDP